MKYQTRKHNKITSVMLLLITIFLIFVLSILNVMAEETKQEKADYYYKSIMIHSGDCLWDIAEIYAESVGMTVSEYVQELKAMNRLEQDQIDAGQYLIVKYVGNE